MPAFHVVFYIKKIHVGSFGLAATSVLDGVAVEVALVVLAVGTCRFVVESFYSENGQTPYVLSCACPKMQPPPRNLTRVSDCQWGALHVTLHV